MIFVPIMSYRIHLLRRLKRLPLKALEVDSGPDNFGLTKQLREIVEAFRSLPDDSERYKSLLQFGSTPTWSTMPKSLQIEENIVPGCLSTVYIQATLKKNHVHYHGDSDSQLTKGLVTVLVKGLSNNTPEDILKVKPEFIQNAGIGASLTPSRNNGFLNMLKTMQAKAQLLTKE
jgi:cysteine desulfuration protein SufE